jgi:hypothetical protein
MPVHKVTGVMDRHYIKSVVRELRHMSAVSGQLKLKNDLCDNQPGLADKSKEETA